MADCQTFHGEYGKSFNCSQCKEKLDQGLTIRKVSHFQNYELEIEGGDNLDFQKLDGAPSIPCSTMKNINKKV